MVLEGATAPASDDSFFQDTPASDLDTYSDEPQQQQAYYGQGGNNSGKGGYRIDPERLPYILAPLPAPITQAGVRAVEEQLDAVEKILNRRVTQPEVDALSYHFVRGMQITSYGVPIGLTAGMLAAYNSRATWSFPFWKPKEGGRFNPDRFFILEGANARRVWSFARYNAYAFSGLLLASIFFGTYSVSVSGAGRASDPRLKDFNEILKIRIQQARGTAPAPPVNGQRSPITTREGGMDHQVDKAREILERNRPQQSRQQQQHQQQSRTSTQDDDMSPTSGKWMEDFNTSSGNGLMSDRDIQQQERQQRTRAETSATASDDSSFDTNRRTSQPRNRENDASTAGDTGPSKPRPAGSSWERIRKEAASAGPNPQSQEQRQGRTAGWGSVQKEQQQGSTLGDSFAFSKSDEDRQLAKDEAQRDFDDRVERERRGEDFAQDKRKRW